MWEYVIFVTIFVKNPIIKYSFLFLHFCFLTAKELYMYGMMLICFIEGTSRKNKKDSFSTH